MGIIRYSWEEIKGKMDVGMCLIGMGGGINFSGSTVLRAFGFLSVDPNSLSCSGWERQEDRPRSPSIGLVGFIDGRFILSGFQMMCSEPFLNFSFRKKSRPDGSESIYCMYDD